jgi:hypothetical protein
MRVELSLVQPLLRLPLHRKTGFELLLPSYFLRHINSNHSETSTVLSSFHVGS